MDKKFVPKYFNPYRILFYTFQGLLCIDGISYPTPKTWREPEKINSKLNRNWENTGKIVMRKTSFREIWAFWIFFSSAPIRTFSSELFYTSFYIYSRWKEWITSTRFLDLILRSLAFFSPLSPFLLYFLFLFSLQVGLY